MVDAGAGEHAVLLLAHGGPESLDEVPRFLERLRGGAPVGDAAAQPIMQRYRRIGGGSPLPAIVRRLAGRLEAAIGLPVFSAMRFSQPSIPQVVSHMSAAGFRRITAICLAPHFSGASVGLYRRAVERAIQATGTPIEMLFRESWGDHPRFIAAIARSVAPTMARLDPADRDSVVIMFTAHSLPAAALTGGDPYPQQVEQTCRLAANAASVPDDRWVLAYQSARIDGGAWLGPAVEDVLRDLAAAGRRSVVVAPIGFVCDNLEILYDIDIQLAQSAASLGLRLERTPMLNDGDEMVSVLAAIVSEAGSG